MPGITQSTEMGYASTGGCDKIYGPKKEIEYLW
jgi:hypothetical protein